MKKMKFNVTLHKDDIYDLIYEASANVFDNIPHIDPMDKNDLSVEVDNDDTMNSRKTPFKMIKVQAYGRSELSARWYPLKDDHNKGKVGHWTGNSVDRIQKEIARVLHTTSCYERSNMSADMHLLVKEEAVAPSAPPDQPMTEAEVLAMIDALELAGYEVKKKGTSPRVHYK
ncbi:hypothetical protein J8273_8364 [Carpediemonas membranifera]|uniref:Uncharacterized protein n=1 Tax=Carpediemonas membranifera TaxID=201153 RepID=A0A8J6AWV5_9EUKA|nr:hypothetical protein J8273_8364 [Carpediemonas membranifera]|eukprot:KAG9390318.1 hypothetical protein J8273_8364 [Carpediemonas membranifera]